MSTSISPTHTPTPTHYKRIVKNGDCYHVITFTIENGVEKFISRVLIINNNTNTSGSSVDIDIESEDDHKTETDKYFNDIKKENEKLIYNIHEIIYRKPKYQNKYSL